MPPRSDTEAMDQPTLLRICNISYGECATDEPFCVRQPHIFEKASSLLGGQYARGPQQVRVCTKIMKSL